MDEHDIDARLTDPETVREAPLPAHNEGEEVTTREGVYGKIIGIIEGNAGDPRYELQVLKDDAATGEIIEITDYDIQGGEPQQNIEDLAA